MWNKHSHWSHWKQANCHNVPEMSAVEPQVTHGNKGGSWKCPIQLEKWDKEKSCPWDPEEPRASKLGSSPPQGYVPKLQMCFPDMPKTNHLIRLFFFSLSLRLLSCRASHDLRRLQSLLSKSSPRQEVNSNKWRHSETTCLDVLITKRLVFLHICVQCTLWSETPCVAGGSVESQ